MKKNAHLRWLTPLLVLVLMLAACGSETPVAEQPLPEQPEATDPPVEEVPTEEPEAPAEEPETEPEAEPEVPEISQPIARTTGCDTPRRVRSTTSSAASEISR